MTWQEAAKTWASGGIVWSVELGGLGPSYEQSIQILLFEVLAAWGDRPFPVQASGTQTFPEVFSTHVDEQVKRLNDMLQLSGAQYGAAKSTAYQFMNFGYSEMMNKLPTERLIQVTRYFPAFAPGDCA